MDYEKKYKEAFERAKEKYTTCYSSALLEYIFPELKESEGERIRKELLEHCKNQAKPYIQTGNKCPQIQSWIAWLKKQGEKDVRQKFLGDLLVADDIYQMSINEAMVEEARTKAINALSELEISKLLGIEKQGEQNPIDKFKPKFKVGDTMKEADLLKEFDKCCEDYIFDDEWDVYIAKHFFKLGFQKAQKGK